MSHSRTSPTPSHTTLHHTTPHHTILYDSAANQSPHHHHATPYTAPLTRGAPIRQKAADYFYAQNSTTGFPHPQHRVFLINTPKTSTFNPDSGATDILIRRQDSDALQNLHYFTDANPAPTFYVANNTIIDPYAVGTLHPPNTTLTIQAYAFKDEDLADNLFGLAPLLNQGCTATFTGQSCSITGPRNEGQQLIFYGTKPPYANAWKFIFYGTKPPYANQPVRPCPTAQPRMHCHLHRPILLHYGAP